MANCKARPQEKRQNSNKFPIERDCLQEIMAASECLPMRLALAGWFASTSGPTTIRLMVAMRLACAASRIDWPVSALPLHWPKRGMSLKI